MTSMLKDLLEGKPLRHPLHPMLVHFPIGLFILSLLLDFVGFIFSSFSNAARASFDAMLLGEIMALLAAVPGFVDYTDIRRDHPGKRPATMHMALNLVVVVLYGINLWIRSSALSGAKVGSFPLILSLVGVVLLCVSGYLGGRLVYDEGIAVGRHKRRMPTPKDTLHLTAPIAGADGVFVPVGAAQQLREREALRVEIDGQVMALTRIENQLFAFQEFCPHRFGPLSEGSFDGFNVKCPWHNSCFDVRTGKVTNGPAKVDLKVFKIETRDGKVAFS